MSPRRKTSPTRAGQRAAQIARSRLRDDLDRLIDDAGLSVAAVARASGLTPSFVARVLTGEAGGSLESFGRLAAALGADLVVHLYPNTGPPIRDRHQAAILEALLAQLHPRWKPFTEVVVTRPARGVIDAVLVHPCGRDVVAVEIQSELRRLEQLVRWSNEKAASLPSSSVWARMSADGEPPIVSSLLVVRRTRANVEIARMFGRQIEVACPAHPADALRALRTERGWPGSALVWARLDRAGVHFMPAR